MKYSVSCDPRDLDRYGRVVAVCFKGNEDLNRWMVANGWAVAYRRYSLDYAADEAAARPSGINIWSGSFDMPWNWRAQPEIDDVTVDMKPQPEASKAESSGGPRRARDLSQCRKWLLRLTCQGARPSGRGHGRRARRNHRGR